MSTAPDPEHPYQPQNLSGREGLSKWTTSDRWAIIVGISKYRHVQLDLVFAHRDAKELSTFLQTPSGGGLAGDQIQELIDDAATTANLYRALRSFLKRPTKKDVVIIFLACHSAADPDRPENLYLLTHDTDPDDISATALPMREIAAALRDNLLAERVVIIADIFHSAAMSGRRSLGNAAVTRSFQELSKAKQGIAMLTSARANETSREDAVRGGGRSVFTQCLLEGLEGAADRDKNGIVTVDELFQYVRASVEEATATSNSQRPVIEMYTFDDALPLAITPTPPSPALALAVLADGQRALAGAANGTCWEQALTANAARTARYGPGEPITALAFAADGTLAIAGAVDYSLRVWNPLSGQQVYRLHGHADRVSALAFTDDRRRALSASADGSVRVWDLESGRLLSVLAEHTGPVTCVAVTADGTMAASAGVDRTVIAWSLADGLPIARFTIDSPIAACSITPNGQAIAVGDQSGHVHLFDLASPRSARPQIFISHSARDGAGATLLASLTAALDQAGYEALGDTERIQFAANWRAQFPSWLLKCDAAIALLTKDALGSSFVVAELTTLVDRRAKDPGFLLIPVLVAPATFADVDRSALSSLNLTSIQMIQTRPTESDRVTEQILATLRQRLGAQPG